jgi:hypothetical protein
LSCFGAAEKASRIKDLKPKMSAGKEAKPRWVADRADAQSARDVAGLRTSRMEPTLADRADALASDL